MMKIKLKKLKKSIQKMNSSNIHTGYEYFFIDAQSVYTSNNFIEYDVKNKKEAKNIDYGMFIISLKDLKMKELSSIIDFLKSTKL